jgi:hypothetical protein
MSYWLKIIIALRQYMYCNNICPNIDYVLATEITIEIKILQQYKMYA